MGSALYISSIFALLTIFAHGQEITGICPDPWVHFQQSCYALIESPSTWAEAQDICGLYESYLVEIDSTEENTFVYNFIQNRSVNNHHVWTGGNDLLKESTWVWGSSLDGLTYTDWCPGNPNNGNKEHEDCLVIKTHDDCILKWNDDQCYSRHYFMCEHQITLNPVIG